MTDSPFTVHKITPTFNKFYPVSAAEVRGLFRDDKLVSLVWEHNQTHYFLTREGLMHNFLRDVDEEIRVLAGDA